MGLLQAAGIAVLAGRLARDADAAVAAAGAIGWPVALKLQSPDLPHKSDVGGVALDLDTPAAVRAAFTRLHRGALAASPSAEIHGCWVQRMSPPGIEMIVGLQHDPVFGPMVLVGAGGVLVEADPDVALAPAPVDRETAAALIRGLRIAPVLAGTRGRRPADIDALANLVAGLSRIALAWAGRLESLDINPVLVHAAGDGVSIADALIITRGTADA
jgi:hypothetical protein